MNSTDAALSAIPLSSPQLHTWEHSVIWFVLAAGAFGLFGFPYAAGSTWVAVWELTRTGALPIIGFGPPIIFFIGSVLLFLRRKSSTVWFGVHIPLAIAYLSSRYGIGSISPFWWFGYVCEVLLVCFCLRLWSRGAIK